MLVPLADNEDGMYGYRMPIPNAWCVPLIFAPTTAPEVMALMTTVARRNGFDDPVEFDSAAGADVTAQDLNPAACAGAGRNCILGFRTTDDMKEWSKRNSGRAGAGVLFGDSWVTTLPSGEEIIEEVVLHAL